jgi:hypothetical protein
MSYVCQSFSAVFMAAVSGLLCHDHFAGAPIVQPFPPFPPIPNRTGPAPRPDAFLATVFQSVTPNGCVEQFVRAQKCVDPTPKIPMMPMMIR